MLQNVGQGHKRKAAKCLKFRKSFTVWKSEFDHFIPVKLLHMLNTIIKIVKLYLK